MRKKPDNRQTEGGGGVTIRPWKDWRGEIWMNRTPHSNGWKLRPASSLADTIRPGRLAPPSYRGAWKQELGHSALPSKCWLAAVGRKGPPSRRAPGGPSFLDVAVPGSVQMEYPSMPRFVISKIPINDSPVSYIEECYEKFPRLQKRFVS